LRATAIDNPVRQRAAKAGIDLTALPAHIAVIMDGNGRWAKSKGLMRLLGHREGYLTLRNVLLAAGELGIGCLTVYGFSVENWRRPESEVSGLMKLIEEAARNELKNLVANNVQARASGRLDELPPTLHAALDELRESTRQNTGIVLNLAINYGGRAEIVDAVKDIVASGLPEGEVTEDAISARTYSPDLPEPDLIVRTAGEMRWSNFLLWQSAYSELYVTQTTWPDFDESELFQAVLAYQARKRKFGGLGESG